MNLFHCQLHLSCFLLHEVITQSSWHNIMLSDLPSKFVPLLATALVIPVEFPISSNDTSVMYINNHVSSSVHLTGAEHPCSQAGQAMAWPIDGTGSSTVLKGTGLFSISGMLV